MKGGAAASVLVLAFAPACAQEEDPLWAALLEGLPCSAEVTSTLIEWKAGDEILRGPPLASGSETVRIATPRRGEWVTIEQRGGVAPTAAFVRPEGVERASWDEGCNRMLTSDGDRPGEPSSGPVFTDADLRAALEVSTVPSVVYVWSPHMPLSVDGYAEIAAACGEFGFSLVAVLFPGSDVGFAAEEARRVGIPEEALAESASVELMFRDAHVHAPALLVFDGPRTSPVLPGYRDAAGYGRYLEAYLSDAGAPSNPD